MDILLQYYEELGKPTPKVEVMRYLKSKEYTDAKGFAGECESVVMIAKGQSTNLLFLFFEISLVLFFVLNLHSFYLLVVEFMNFGICRCTGDM